VTSRLRGSTTRRALAGALGLVLLWPAAIAMAQPAEWPLTVATLAGTVEVSRQRAAWARVALRDTLGATDSARTLLQSRLTLRTANGNSLRMAPLSQIVLAPAEGAAAVAPAAPAPAPTPPSSTATPPRPAPLPGPPGPVKVRLDAGWLWAAVLPLPGAAVFQIDAGPATIVIRGSGVGIRREGDGGALVRVYHGGAVVSGTAAGQRWERALAARQELLVPGAAAPGAPRPLTREPFEEPWIRWNEEQDFAAYAGPPLQK
jgi:hypothetical protein